MFYYKQTGILPSAICSSDQNKTVKDQYLDAALCSETCAGGFVQPIIRCWVSFLTRQSPFAVQVWTGICFFDFLNHPAPREKDPFFQLGCGGHCFRCAQ